jgi:hypothetical protein
MANEMRDRLVESIETARDDWWEKAGHNKTSKASADYIADCLLDDGWIRPPCKVEDKIWYITTSYMTKIPKVQKGYVEKIIITQNGIDLIADNYVSKLTYGKRSFLTKSEAEQKLKEMRGDTNA